MRRYVLALEGADGSGKSTIASMLRELCELRSIPVRLLGRSAADAPPSVAALTDVLRAHGLAYSLEADLMIRVAREFQRARDASLVASGLVILDRFVLSVLARNRADAVLPSPVEPLLLRAVEAASLDATLFVDCPFEVAWARVHASAASEGRARGAKELRGEGYNRAFLEHQRSLFDSGECTGVRLRVDNSSDLAALLERVQSTFEPVLCELIGRP